MQLRPARPVMYKWPRKDVRPGVWSFAVLVIVRESDSDWEKQKGVFYFRYLYHEKFAGIFVVRTTSPTVPPNSKHSILPCKNICEKA
ncbi:hypothetical protein DL98DRAFT_515617 [Cadophora sp. DSE1049]|nr:hypothetical protein DL98DRAFT_515617 [Cadophora sp. DSE1049]